jgi:hypothetical protein
MLPNTIRRVKSGSVEPVVYMYITHFICSLHVSLLVYGLVDWLFDIFRQFTQCCIVMFSISVLYF